MVEVNENRLITHTATAGEIFVISYTRNTHRKLDILNTTSGNILVNTENSFDTENVLKIPAGYNYEGLRNLVEKEPFTIYIKCESAGDVVIVDNWGD